MPRQKGSKTFTKYKVKTLPATLSDDKLELLLKEQASMRFELVSVILVLGVGLRLFFKSTNNVGYI